MMDLEKLGFLKFSLYQKFMLHNGTMYLNLFQKDKPEYLQC